MKKALVYIILIFIWMLPARDNFAALITGKVVDIYTQAPIDGAKINIPGTEYKTTTSHDGYFSLVTSDDDDSADYFHISSIENLLIWQAKNPLTMEIYSILGQKIYINSKTVGGSGELNLQFLTNGIYVLRYRVNGDLESVKFIKTAKGLVFPVQRTFVKRGNQDEFGLDSLEIKFDGYYSQKFAIRKEQANYELLKTHYNSISYLNKLPGPEAFKMLQNAPFTPTFGEVQSVKFIYSIPDKQIYYMNSSEFFIHYDFAAEILDYSKGHYSFNIEQYKNNQNRIFYLGSLNHFKSSDIYTLEFFSGDEITCEGVKELYNKISGTSYIGDKLRFYPNNAKWDVCSNIPKITSAELYQGQNYQPLNPGENFGYLKKVEIDQVGTTYLGRHDLVLLNGIPNDISVVAGIITTDFQTPLSHINVLSHNRGTPNMALLDGWTNPKLNVFIDQLVYLKVTLDSFYVREATIAEAESFWAIKEPTKFQRLKIDTVTTGLVNLNAADHRWVSAIGGKASNFAELMKITFANQPIPIPEGAFAIPISYYWNHLKNNQIDIYLKQMLANPEFKTNHGTRISMLTNLQNLIKDSPVDVNLVKLISDRMETINGFTNIRFRSSTNAEDIEGFNGAGLYNSYTAIKGDNKKTIENAIRKVWASLWNLKAFEEREYFRIDQLNVGMAVLVHRSFPTEEANGVVITENLFNIYNPGITINVQVGEMSIVIPENNYLPDQIIYYAFEDQFPESYNYIGHTTVPGMEGKTVLTPQELKTLNNYCMAIHNHYCRLNFECKTLDIEFKVDKINGQRKIYIKQARLY
ncbi:MAG: T9SS type A sorting domain-containing protein [Prolixibacteraceae bacterium]|nr:T9SS type A sorting domain-containing protein [Prolixibacteraceae bacterium]